MEPIVDSVVYVIPNAGGRLSEWAAILSAIAAAASVVIAFVAVWFSRKQMKMHEHHNRLTVRPHLDDMTHVDEGEGLFRYEITNKGIGPAILTHATVYLDGEPVTAEDTIERAITLLLSDKPHCHWGHESPAIGAYLSPGQVVELVTIRTDERFPPMAIRQHLRERAQLVVKYRSIYGETFEFDSRQSS